MKLRESDINRIVNKVVNEGLWDSVKGGFNNLMGRSGTTGKVFKKEVMIDCIKKTIDGLPGGPLIQKYCAGKKMGTSGVKPAGGGLSGMMGNAAKAVAAAKKTGGGVPQKTPSGGVAKAVTGGGAPAPSGGVAKAVTGGGAPAPSGGVAKAVAGSVPTTGATMNEIWRRIR